MTPARAAEVLRKKEASYRKAADVWRRATRQPLITSASACATLEAIHTEVANSMAMGAEALEFVEWLLALDGDGMMKLHDVMDRWNAEDSFLDYARAEWEKERKNG